MQWMRLHTKVQKPNSWSARIVGEHLHLTDFLFTRGAVNQNLQRTNRNRGTCCTRLLSDRIFIAVELLFFFNNLSSLRPKLRYCLSPLSDSKIWHMGDLFDYFRLAIWRIGPFTNPLHYDSPFLALFDLFPVSVIIFCFQRWGDWPYAQPSISRFVYSVRVFLHLDYHSSIVNELHLYGFIFLGFLA
jgi:hypothetical protein